MSDSIASSYLILLFLFYARCSAMEKEALSAVLDKKNHAAHRAALHLDPEKDCLLTKVPPELTSYIFSFLPGHSAELNYLMRLKEFSLCSGPIESSPLFPIAECIQQICTAKTCS